MRLTVFAATLAFLLWGTHAFAGTAPDFDGDAVGDAVDNCSEHINTAQDDTDGDDCGNLCDADYGGILPPGSGIVGFADFGAVTAHFGGNTAADELYCHTEPIPGCVVGFGSFGFVTLNFGSIPGPSGTTAGTVACP
jgi:hypothetical protein